MNTGGGIAPPAPIVGFGEPEPANGVGDGLVAGAQQIQIGGVTIPVASGAELKARTRCTKTEQFWQGVPDTVLVPRYVLDVIPAC